MTQTTRYLRVDRDHPEQPLIVEAARVLRQGGLVAFATETVYGLGADATNAEAVARIFQAKGRPATNPLIVHGHDTISVRKAVSEWPMAAERLANRFWPGPLTLVLPRSRLIPDVVTGGKETVGIRVPDSEVARALLRESARLVAAPSANRSTRVSPTRAEHVLKDLDGRIDMILDSGATPIGIESTVLDLTTTPPKILRPGAVTQTQIRQALGIEIESPTHQLRDPASVATSPGQMEVHYSPRTTLEIVDLDQVVKGRGLPANAAIGLMVVGQTISEVIDGTTARVDWLDPHEAERAIYETLHRWDDGRLDVIHVVMPPDRDEWRAVRDRLWRASRRWGRSDAGGRS